MRGVETNNEKPVSCAEKKGPTTMSVRKALGPRGAAMARGRPPDDAHSCGTKTCGTPTCHAHGRVLQCVTRTRTRRGGMRAIGPQHARACPQERMSIARVDVLLKTKLAAMYALPHLLACPVCDAFAHKDVYVYVGHVGRCCADRGPVADRPPAARPCTYVPQCVQAGLLTDATVGWHEAVHHGFAVDCPFCPQAQAFPVARYLDHRRTEFSSTQKGREDHATYLACLRRLCSREEWGGMARDALHEALRAVGRAHQVKPPIHVEEEPVRSDPDATESDTDVEADAGVKTEAGHRTSGGDPAPSPLQCVLGKSMVQDARRDGKVSRTANSWLKKGLVLDKEVTSSFFRLLNMRFGEGGVHWALQARQARDLWDKIVKAARERVDCVRLAWNLEVDQLPEMLASRDAGVSRKSEWQRKLKDFDVVCPPADGVVALPTWEDVAAAGASRAVLARQMEDYLTHWCNLRKREGMAAYIDALDARIRYGNFLRKEGPRASDASPARGFRDGDGGAHPYFGPLIQVGHAEFSVAFREPPGRHFGGQRYSGPSHPRDRSRPIKRERQASRSAPEYPEAGARHRYRHGR